MTGRRIGLALIAAVPLTVVLVLFVYPVGVLVGRGVFPAGRFDPQTLAAVAGRARFRRIAIFTFTQAAASAGLCLILGVPGAHLLYRRRFRGRGVLRAALTMPFVLPTVVVALAFRTVFATNGPLGSWGLDSSLTVILLAHVCLNYAVVVRTVGTAWAGLDARPGQAAATLGAGPVRVFLTVTLPALAPAVAAAFVIVFLFCATSFGVVLLLGAGRYDTLETEIYRQTVELLDLPTASVLSIAQLLLVLVTLAVAGWLRRRTEVRDGQRPPVPAGLRAADIPSALVTAVATAVVLGPLVVLALRSLRTPAGWGWANYRALSGLGDGNIALVSVWTALGISLWTAVLAAAISVLLGVLLSVVLARRPRERWARRLVGGLDTLVMLPLGVSAVTVGFGMLIALDKPPLNLRGSWVVVPLAQALVAMPLVVRIILPALRGADDRLRQAAAVLGAGPLRVWADVDLPLMARSLGSATAFSVAVSLGEFGATSFLAVPQRPTLPVLIGRLISRPGTANTGMALAAATVLALACVLVVLVVDAVGRGDRVGSVAGSWA